MEWRWDSDESAKGDEPKAKPKVHLRKAEVLTPSPVLSVRLEPIFPMSGRDGKVQFVWDLDTSPNPTERGWNNG